MLKTEQINQIGVLSKLDVSENIDKLSADLSSILNIIDDLQDIDTTDILPMSNPFDATQRLREDTITETDNKDLYQQNAPLIEKGHYLVPKVL